MPLSPGRARNRAKKSCLRGELTAFLWWILGVSFLVMNSDGWLMFISGESMVTVKQWRITCYEWFFLASINDDIIPTWLSRLLRGCRFWCSVLKAQLRCGNPSRNFRFTIKIQDSCLDWAGWCSVQWLWLKFYPTKWPRRGPVFGLKKTLSDVGPVVTLL